VLGVTVEEAECDLVLRGLHGADLREDVDAVTVTRRAAPQRILRRRVAALGTTPFRRRGHSSLCSHFREGITTPGGYQFSLVR